MAHLRGLIWYLVVALAALLVPQLALAKPLRCGERAYWDEGEPAYIGTLPEVHWQGGLGTKPVRCCVVDLRWLTESPLRDDVLYFKVPPQLEGRCVVGKRQKATIRVQADGHGTWTYAHRVRNPCGVEVTAGTVGAVEGRVGGRPYIPPGVQTSRPRSKPCRVQGMTLTSVGGAFVAP